MNLPNKLTLLRIIAVPFFLLILFLPEWFKASTVPCILIAVLLFIAACVTDTLDGRLARKRHLETDFGKFMDPIADKLLVNSALIMLSHFGELHPIITILFISREFIISGFRLIAATKGIVIAADKYGKIKTLLQMIFIPALLVDLIIPSGSALQPYFSVFWHIVAYAALILSIYSCVHYILRNKGVIDFHDC